MKGFCVLLCLLSAVSAQTGGGASSTTGTDSCTIPTGEQGTCVPWKECPQYQSYIQAGQEDQESAKFLRERVCRVNPPNVSLCCPSNPTTLLPLPLVPFSIPSEDECGIPTRKSANEPGAWPWLAAISQYKPNQGFVPVCSGTLITRRHVLSAASCFIFARDKVVVRLGEYHIEHDDAGERPEDYNIILFNTDYYNGKTDENDIILLQLDRDVVFTDNIRPACLPFPFRDELFTGQRLTVVGWGAPDPNQIVGSKVPVAGNVPVADFTACQTAYRRLNKILDQRNICAGDELVDACRGDGGAPLNYYDPQRDRYYVVGLVSFGVGCANPEFPGVYTRVSSFLDWIKKSLNLP